MWNGISCTGDAATYNWANALQTAKNMGEGWRVPNIKELDSLVEQACYKPSINDVFFPNTVITNYWSSSPLSDLSGRAHVVYFDDGSNSDFAFKGDAKYVRLVRSSQ